MKSIPYGKQALVGKYIATLHKGSWSVYKYTRVNKATGSSSSEPTGEDFVDREDAVNRAFVLNDWQNMSIETVYRCHENSAFAKAYQYQPWEHIWIHNKKMYFYIWDTRIITKVANADYDENALKRALVIIPKGADNGKPLCDKSGRWLYASEVDKLAINYKTPKELGTNKDTEELAQIDIKLKEQNKLLQHLAYKLNGAKSVLDKKVVKKRITLEQDRLQKLLDRQKFLKDL